MTSMPTATSWTIAGDGDATRAAGRYLLDVSRVGAAWGWEVWARRPDGSAEFVVGSGSARTRLDAMLAAEVAATRDATESIRALARWPSDEAA